MKIVAISRSLGIFMKEMTMSIWYCWGTGQNVL